MVVKICLRCKQVFEGRENLETCKYCQSVGFLAYWTTGEKFYQYCLRYKPTNIKSHSDHLQYIIDEALGKVD